LKSKYNISRAKNAQETIEKVKNSSYSVCLMDINMPVISVKTLQ